MLQFEAFTINGGERWLCAIDTSRWDLYLGFRRLIRRLP